MTAPSPARALGMQMLQLATAHFTAHAVHVAARLGIADALVAGARSAEELAADLGAHGPSLLRLLRALGSVGVFEEQPGGRFCLTALGRTLVSDAPGSVRAGAVLFGDPIHWNAWGQLERSVRTGRSGFEQAFGQSLFAYLPTHPQAAEVFDAWMGQATELLMPSILGSYDFSGVRCLLDVGGGRGALLHAVLARHPEMRGILFDLPSVLEVSELLAIHGFRTRCEVVAGSFFEPIPARADACVLKFILHDWDDAAAESILRHCRQAVPLGGRLLVIEMLIPEGNQPHPGKFQDLSMLVLCSGGRERTEAEFRALLDRADFTLQRILPTGSPVCILECR